MSEKTFAPFVAKPGKYGTKLSAKVSDLVAWLQQHQNDGGWINLELKVSKGGKPYVELDTWKPTSNRPSGTPADDDRMPF